MNALRTVLACLLLLHAAPASAQRWTLVETDTLTVIGEESPSQLRTLAIQLEQFREVVGGVFQAASRGPHLPTIVYVFTSRGRMRDHLPLVDGRVVSANGIMSADGEINRIIMTTDAREESSRLAFHEYTHLLVSNIGLQLPVWLNEGLAEFYSTYTLADGGRTADVGRPLVSSVLFLRDRWLPLAEVLAVDASLVHESGQRTVFYPQSWALVHYLLTQLPDSGKAIAQYVAHRHAGLSDADAFPKAFGQTVAEMESNVRAYVFRDLFRIRRFQFSDTIVAKTPKPPRTLSAAEADAWLGDLQRSQERAEGAARIEAAAADAPQVAMAQLALGRLRVEQNRNAEARSALTHAARLAPQSDLVQGVAARNLLRMDGVASDPETVAALRRVAALRPDSAEAQATFAAAAMRTASGRPEARAAIERAMTLAPGRLDYRLRRAEILAADGQIPEARAVFKELSAAVGNPDVASRALTNLERLETEEAQRIADRNALVVRTATPVPPPPPPPTTSSSTWQGPAGAISVGDQTFVLRRPKKGESVVRGTLQRLECLRGLVRYYVRTSNQTIVARAVRTEDVEMKVYGQQPFRPLGCTARTPPDAVVLTWSPDSGATGRTRGVAIAIEFLPATR